MSYDTIVGHVIADINYRLIQVDDTSHLEEHGKIDYDLALGSGTGIAQINDNWYAERSFTVSDTVDLSTLSLTRFGQVFTTSFLGVSGSGNIKGIKFDNWSNESLYVTLPFNRFSGEQEIRPSGSITFSNARGWTISGGNTAISIVGDTSDPKQYSIGVLGVTMPAFRSIDAVMNIEYALSGISGECSGILMIDYLASSQNTGTMPIEYNVSISSISGVQQIEYLRDAIGTGLNGSDMPVEYLSTLDSIDNFLNIEWTGYSLGTGSYTGTGCSGCGLELLNNPTFQYGYVGHDQYVPSSTNFFNCDPPIGFPGWYASGLVYRGVAGNDLFMSSGRLQSSTCSLGNLDTFGLTTYFGFPSTIRQTVSVTTGYTYQFDWYPTEANAGESSGEWPYVRLLSGAGVDLVKATMNQSFMDVSGSNQCGITAIATDGELTVEFWAPEKISGGSSAPKLRLGGGNIGDDVRISLYKISN
jgi:hypothetical protein